MSALMKGRDLTLLQLGTRVDRAAATLPQGAQAPLFTVSGGRVAITQIIGQVTTIMETKQNATKLVSNPTVGSDVDMCATLDVTADEVGTLYSISGLSSDALQGTAAGSVSGQARRVVVAAGTIDLNCGGSATGGAKWTLFFFPIDDGATVTAA